MSSLPIAVQVYSVRDDASADLYATLKKIKDPRKNCLQIILSYGCAAHITLTYLIRYTLIFAKILLDIRKPRARIYGIAQFLFRQLFACYIDDLEPIKLFRIRAFADIDHQLIIKYFVCDLL